MKKDTGLINPLTNRLRSAGVTGAYVGFAGEVAKTGRFRSYSGVISGVVPDMGHSRTMAHDSVRPIVHRNV